MLPGVQGAPGGAGYGSLRFRWVKAPPSGELAHLTQTLARHIGRYLERQGLLDRYAENGYLAGDALEVGPLEKLLGSSVTYRIAVGPHQGRKVFTLQTLPGSDESFDDGVGKVAGFALHAGMMAFRGERESRMQAPMTAIRRFRSRKRPFTRPILILLQMEKEEGYGRFCSTLEIR